MRMRGIGLLLASVASAGLVLAGCGSASPASNSPASNSPASNSPASSMPQGLDAFYGQELAWSRCAGYPASAEAEQTLADGKFLCARLSVPLDYAKPDGPTAQIAVVTLRGASSSGSLVVNPGGPGGSGLEWAASEAESVARGPLGREFDIVSFDPRGVGASTPRIECLSGAQQDAVRAKDTFRGDPAGVAAAQAQDQEFVDACVANTGVEVLANVGTRQAAQDLDILRAALGDEQLNYLGFSYGTLLGTVYAQQFPDRVRAMVLDGAVDPNEDPVASVVNQGAGFQLAFDEFARDCAQVSDCPLGSNPQQADPKQAVIRYRQLIDQLRGAPAQTTDPRGLSQSDAETGTIQALYSRSLWGSLRRGLTELAAGRGDSLLQLADQYYGRDSGGDGGGYRSNIGAAFDAIRCVDVQPGLTSAEAGAVDTAYRAAAPFLDDGTGTGIASPDLCDLWPVPATLAWSPQMPALPPTVVVSTTQDSATPHQAGVDLAKLLGSALITVEGTSHTAAFGNNCVDAAIDAYFLDLTIPEAGLTCGD